MQGLKGIIIAAGVVGLVLLLAVGGFFLGKTTKGQNEVKATTEPPTLVAEAHPPDYWGEVKPVLDARCVVCHGCYDAPCQMNLSAHEGIVRGANKTVVYDPGRLLAIAPTRLFEDAHSTEQWRKMDFFPVLNEGKPVKTAQSEASVMARMLQLKRDNPQPKTSPLPASFDFSLDRKQFCATSDSVHRFTKEKPLWGMPYGLPNLANREFDTLMGWIEGGAPYREPSPTTGKNLEDITRWEHFLNGDGLKTQLMARYLYEHLFLAHIYFDEGNSRTFFRLVRSRTPPGEPLDTIGARRPYDDPKVKRVYYRITPLRTTILAKTHMPYAFNPARMARYTALFLEPDYAVTRLPSYKPEIAANPFDAFQDIPLDSRYRFLLDEARFTIMNFIKGPVCLGQVALGVINQRFWIVFVNPNNPEVAHGQQEVTRDHHKLKMPTVEASNTDPISTWLKYSKLEKKYFTQKLKYMREALRPEDITLDLVWDGDGSNDNAALTVFRHRDNATVVKGFVGDTPKTVVALGYPLLERIHYLLVAGYDIFGNIGHQLSSRLYMDFIRMDGEFNFLTLLPKDARRSEWDFWYRDTDEKMKAHLEQYMTLFDRETGIEYQTQQPKQELIGLLKKRLKPVLNTAYAIPATIDVQVAAALKKLSNIQGLTLSWLPQVAFLRIEDLNEGDYTLLHSNGLSNVSDLFFEKKRRLPKEDTLTVVRGFLGAYPNAFYQMKKSELPAFVNAIEGLRGEADYRALVARFGIDRRHPDFWAHSDQLIAAYREQAPIEAGLFDYNRLENR